MASLASLAEEPYTCPQLFLYSNTDALISAAVNILQKKKKKLVKKKKNSKKKEKISKKETK